MDEGGKDLKDGTRARRRAAPWLFGGLVLLLLSVLVLLQVFGLWEVFTPETAGDTLLIYALSTLNFVAFVLFTFIFIRSLLKLRRERRERQLGSKIKTRLVVYFIAVSLLPITAMAVFSYLFFNRTVEKWFGRIPEGVVQEARSAREEDAAQQAQALVETARVASLMADRQIARGETDGLNDLLAAGNFDALGIDAGDNVGLMRFRSEDFDLPQSKGLAGGMQVALLKLEKEGQGHASIITDDGVTAAAVAMGGGKTFLAARFFHPDPRLAKIVSGAEDFEHLRSRQRKIRMLGLSTLGLMTLLLLFAATWAAIHLARGIGTPVRKLAEAAKEVAAGNLSHRVEPVTDDELALLADAFNDMTAQLAENRSRLEANSAELREKNLTLEERRNYIETVLQTVSTGVISLDEENRVTTINAAALAMLRLEFVPLLPKPLSEVVSAEDCEVLERVLWRARVRGRATEQIELARGPAQEAGGAGGVIPVALTATALTPHEAVGRRGVVLVIEDLSELLAAQRAAAWSEVARRLAHEIKNPLTPIQLSAERIARNFRRLGGGEENGGASPPGALTNGNADSPSSANGNGHDADRERVSRVVEECTATISREVAGLKAMVDEFSRFARLPHARLEPADLNDVVRQAVSLYEDRLEGVSIDVLLAPTLPGAMLDPEQIRRVFVNLIDNSIEAMAEVEGERRVRIATGHDPARGLLIAEVADTGHGIARADFARLFQPYFSTRGRDTGLGLAIVHRIMTEHGGRIRAESNRPRGARMIIELPVAEDAR